LSDLGRDRKETTPLSLELARACADALDTLKDLEDGEAAPTVAQLEKLRGWRGWGPLAPALERWQQQDSWKQLGTRIKGLLSRSEEQHATVATATAYYTTPEVASAMWGLLDRAGFTGGRVLEPGCGSGEFFDHAPPGMPVTFTGVEMDPTSATIARFLHPDVEVVNAPLQKTPLRVGSFDAVIGNVPFADVPVYDPAWEAEGGGFKLKLHSYFLWRAVEATRPGGLICLITSRYTMDAEGEDFRAFLSRKAAFVGAIRLPTGAFNKSGTKVVCDIVLLRRNTGDEPKSALVGRACEWEKSTPRPELSYDGHTPVCLNTYWDRHPGMVLGRFAKRGGAQYGHVLDVVPPAGEEPADLLGRAVNQLADAARAAGFTFSPDTEQQVDAVTDDPSRREGAHTLHEDGTVTRIEDGEHVTVRASAELKHLILLRDAACDLFDAEGDASTPDEQIRPLRDHCRALYRQYVDKFGPLNRSALRNGKPDPETGLPTVVRTVATLGGIRVDPDWPTLSAVEDWDDATEQARPAQILLRRVNTPVVRKTHTDSPAEAVALCRDELGRFDLTRAADLLGVETLGEAAERLAGLVFQDPSTLDWEAAEEYLSGDVRAKLRNARTAADADPERWAGNVAALEAVQPDDLGPAEIYVKLGSPWVAAGDVRDFIAETFEVAPKLVTVRHEPFTATWEVKAGPARDRVLATTTYGTARVNAIDLIAQALNGAAPVVFDKYEVYEDGRTKEVRVRNQTETLLAEERQKAVQEAFVAWLWADPDRTDRLVRHYNDVYNAVRLRMFDGSGYTFPGLAGVDLYAHQRDMIARIVATKNAATLCGFGVGAGKTLIMVASAMKMRELGLVRKPLIVVPNHLLEQVAGDARRHYPGARVLMVTKKDLTKERRKAFAAKVAANDWDLVVMTHTQFQAMPVSPGIEAEYVEKLIFQYEQAAFEGEDLEDSRVIKRLGKQIMKLRERHARLMDARRDDGLFFDRLGIDFLFVDEAHFFKNLAAPTRMEGFSMPGSKRAEDLHMKVEWLRERNRDGRCAALFTGTPVTNTLAEVYTLLRYLCPQLLHEKGLDSFDAFAGMFVVYESKIEVSPDGSGFRMHRRPSKFCNVPELRLLLGQYADIRSRRKLGLKGPKNIVRKLVEVTPPDELADIIAKLVERADKIRAGKVKPDEDNMLAVCGESRAAGLDVRLVGVTPSGPGKVESVAANVATVYHAHKNRLYEPLSDDDGALWMERPGAFQLVFCDLGTPGTKKGDQAYGWMKAEMVARGVPADQIRYIHEATSDAERKALFAACRDGRISVLIASTAKAGTGVNVQHRLVAIHHVDITWRPDEMEQRDGRGDRPGNKNTTLLIFTYVTVGSFDPYMLQGNERKQRMIDQITDGDASVREVMDVPSENEQRWAMFKAVSTGQERVLELEDAKADVARLQHLAVAHSRDITRMRGRADDLQTLAQRARSNAHHLRLIGEAAEGGEPILSRMAHRFTTPETVAEYLQELAATVLADKHDQYAGEWRGVEVTLRSTVQRAGKLKPGVGFALCAPRRYTSIPFPAVRDAKHDGARLLAEIDRAIADAPIGADAEEKRAAHLEQEREDILPMLAAAFPQQDELDTAIERRDQIQAEIQAEVDKAAKPKDATPVAA
jgi:N12 class adenine-specific DNA methylase